jgi:hypothetical protein
MEIGIAITEGIGYRIFFKQSWLSCMALSVIANLTSYAVTVFFFH